MNECISTVKIAALVNGSPSPQFEPQRGLRQGDPLSPFLFNVVVEALNILFKRANTGGLVNGVKIGGDGPTLTHLQYADDTVIFCNADIGEVRNIKRFFEVF